MIELHPDTVLTRQQAADALTEAGFPTTKAMLEARGVRGTGPAFRRYGRVVIYRWGDVIDWARTVGGPPQSSAAAGRAQRRRLAAQMQPEQAA